MPNQAGGEREAHFVQSLERGLSVITAFGPDTESLTLSDVARLTGLTRAAARRFLLTLVDLGYVSQDGKRFALTAKVLGWATRSSPASRCRGSPSRTSSASPATCTSRRRCRCSTAPTSCTSPVSRPRAS